MNQQKRSILVQLSSRFPSPPGVWFSYGTSGFRTDVSLLDSTVFRVWILAALRSIQTGSVIGLMITASHNEVSDNGVKVADPSSGMLTQRWEPFADAIANASDPHSLIKKMEAKEEIHVTRSNANQETQQNKILSAKDSSDDRVFGDSKAEKNDPGKNRDCSIDFRLM